MCEHLSTCRLCVVILLSFAGFSGTASFSAGPDSRELEEDHELSLEFTTPHTDWATPYAGGKTRVLFFAEGHGTNPRNIIELMQRFDLQAQAIYWAKIVDSPVQHWHGGEAGIARMHRLLSQTWDCYVFLGIPPSRMPVEQQYAVLFPVTRGAGLVMVGTDDTRILKLQRQEMLLPGFLAIGTPFTGLSFAYNSAPKDVPAELQTDAVAASKMIAAFKVKDGRAVRLPAPPVIPYRVGWDTEYDYWCQLVGRAILWAAGKQPKATVNVTVNPSSLNRSLLPREETITLSLQYDGQTKSIILRVTLRRDDGWRMDLPSERVTDMQRRVVYVFTRSVPLLRAGRYFVDVQATSEDGVEGWASASFEVTSSRAVQSVILDKPWGEIGEKRSVTVVLDGTPSASVETLRLDLCDRRNRILVRKETRVQGEKCDFTFRLEPWMPMLLRVDATLVADGQDVDSAYEYLNVTKRHRGQFNFLIWDVPRGTLAPYAEESLARNGVTVHLATGTPDRCVAAYDMAWVPYATRILANKDERGHMLPTCWNHEPAILEHVRSIVQSHEKSRQHGVFVYSLGDEGVTRGGCTHPDCIAAFREFLKREYSTIAALNQSWNTNYQSFSEVSLAPPHDADAVHARRLKMYPRWYDRQAFQSANFASLCRRFVDEFAKLDPQARVGFEGAGSFEQNDDYDRIIHTNGFWSPYPGLGDEIIRSIAPRDFIRSNWMGYTKDANSLLAKYWRMVTRGCDSVWWWRWDCIGAFHGFLAPHLAPFAAVKELLKDTQVVRDGLGTLLIRSQMQDDGIVLLYSMPSAYATQVEVGPSFYTYTQTHAAWSRAIRELGLQYRYMTDRMLRGGTLDVSTCKVLVLARCESIADRDADAIRKYVHNGGCVIADLRPGLYDGHCKPRPVGVLDDLFGVTRVARNEAPVSDAALLSVGDINVRLEEITCDPAVRLTEGKARVFCGKTPVLITRSFGKGKAILLNFSLATYPALGNPFTPEPAASVLRELFASAGVVPTVAVTGLDGSRARNVEIVRWRNGQIDLMALFRETGTSQTVRVTLPEYRHIYNLRERVYLGRLQAFMTHVIPCRATFFAFSPDAVPAVRMQTSEVPVVPGSLVKVFVEVPGERGLHAVCLRATLPDGTYADWVNQVLIVGPQGATADLPIAYNDPSGAWTLKATELYTGKSRNSMLKVL